MRHLLVTTAAAALFAMGCYRVDEELSFRDETRVSSEGALYLSHEVVVRLPESGSEAALADAVAELKAEIVPPTSSLETELRFRHVLLPKDVMADDAISFLLERGVVTKAERNYVVSVETTPNDPYYPSLWGMPAIKAPEAWNTRTDCSSVVVAVTDTGVRRDHPDLAANTWTNPGEIAGNGVDDDGNGSVDDVYGWDYANNDNDPMDDHYHGTHVAGTIGGAGNNGLGVAGVCWKAKIMAVKMLGASGSGTLLAGAQAVLYAAKNGAKVVNASWGCPGCYASYMEEAIAELGNNGGLFVAAAGNSATDIDRSPFYPAAYALPNVISVAAIQSGDTLASFSNYGATKVHVAAPGTSIMSTYPPNSYAYLQGTSMAAPHVAGAAALMRAAAPQLSMEQARSRLLSTVRPVQGLVGKISSGGVLNVQAMLSSDFAPPAKVEGVVATAGERSDVTVSWTAGTESDIASYKVRWGTTSGFYPSAKTTGAEETSLRIESLENGKAHFFTVIAIDKGGNQSPVSDETTAVPADRMAPAQVLDLRAEALKGRVASGDVLEASSQASAYYRAANLYDGSELTDWVSEATEDDREEHVVVALTKPELIDRVELVPSAAYPGLFPVDFDIAVSNGAASWTVVGGARGVDQAMPMSFFFAPTTATHVKLSVKRKAQHESSLYYAAASELRAHVVSNRTDTLVVSFTAPGDDPGEGTSKSYDLRMSNQPIDEANFDFAVSAGLVTPSAAGLKESVEIKDLEAETTYYFAMIAYDEAGNASPLSNLASGTTVVIPPGAITDLRVLGTADGQVGLGWTAPGSDGTVGTAASYDMRLSTEPITPAVFDLATPVEAPLPASVGTEQDAIVKDLEVGKLYYFALRALDEGGALGAVSNVVSATASGGQDVTPPAAVVDLQAYHSASQRKLSLSVVDYSSQQAYAEATRAVDGSLTTGWVTAAATVDNPEWITLDLGAVESVSRFRLYPYLSIHNFFPKAVDFEVSADGLHFATLVHAEGLVGKIYTWDEWTAPPTPARFLRLMMAHAKFCADGGTPCASWLNVALGEIEAYALTQELDLDLAWIAPGDDAWMGTAAYYELRHATELIDASNFDQATPIETRAPQPAGGLELVTVGDIGYETTHYFALRAFDDAGNASLLSNVASYVAPAVLPAPVTDLSIVDVGPWSAVLGFTATGDDGSVGTATAYDLRYSTQPISPLSWDAAEPVLGLPAPLPSGTNEQISVEGLESGTTYYFAIKAIDDWDGVSLMSNLAVLTTDDATAPATVNDLVVTVVDPKDKPPVTASVLESSGSFSPENAADKLVDHAYGTYWLSQGRSTEVGETVRLGMQGIKRLREIRLVPASGYEDLFPVDFRIEARLDSASAWFTVVTETGFVSDGQSETWSLGSLVAGELRLVITKTNVWTARHFAALSEVEVIEDTTDYTGVRLAWTASGDDGHVGQAASYDLRRAGAPIETQSAFDGAEPVSGAPTPSLAGALERLEVRGLAPETDACFALTTMDEAGNTSTLSNTSCVRTPGLPPSTVADLRMVRATPTTVTLAWTAPGGDGAVGRASRYELRMSGSRLTEQSFAFATLVSVPFAPADAGSTEQLEVSGLASSTSYHFALVAYDASDLRSNLSNDALAATADGLPPSSVTDLVASTDSSASGSLLLAWTSPTDVGPAGKASEYELRVSQSPIHASNFSSATRIVIPAPKSALSPETARIMGLAKETLYYVALRSKDADGNLSALSNIADAQTRAEAPAAVADLRVTATTGPALNAATATLAWTAPGDDGTVGQASSYDLRFSTSPINDASFPSAARVTTQPPSASGTSEQLTVGSLEVGTRYYFALKTSDERGTTSTLSNVATAVTADAVAPARVANLAAATGLSRGAAILTFTASGDDGSRGSASDYDIRYATSPITDATFASAIKVSATVPSTPAGTPLSVTVSSLPDEALLYVAIKAVDDVGNASLASNSPSVRTLDVAPSAVSDLGVGTRTVSSIAVRFTAPGDDGSLGTASSYDLRYSTSPITTANFAAAVKASTVAPSPSGTQESVTVSGLAGNATYYFALKTADDRGNVSAMSNVLQTATRDNVAPGLIDDLTATTGPLPGTILLSWTATGDDGEVGRAASTEIRRSLAPITAQNFASATLVSGAPTPASSGTPQMLNAANLPGENLIHFAMRALDEEGNAGPISTSVSASTPPVAPSAVADLSATPGSHSATLRWTASGDDGTTGTAASYEIRTSLAPIYASNFTSATLVPDPPTPSLSGTPQSVVVTGLTESTKYYFALVVIDDVGARSGISNVPFATIPDETAPAAPSALSAVTLGDESAPLPLASATASSSLDPSLGAANAIDEDRHTKWVSEGAEPGGEDRLTIDLGTAQSIDRVSLWPDATYLGLFPQDLEVWTSQNGVAWSLAAQQAAVSIAADDSLTFGFEAANARFVELRSFDPPASFFGLCYSVVAEVEVQSARPSSGSVRLSWVAPGDDGLLGRASSYEVYRHTAPFDLSSLGLSTRVSGAPVPQTSGSAESMLVSGLRGETAYYFAVRAKDEAGNVGPLSSLVSKTTVAVPPSPVSDLSASAQGTSSVALSWTATGDDGRTGTAASYELRYAPWTMTEESFPLASQWTAVPIPSTPGSTEHVTVTGLNAGTTYRFAIVTRDEVQTTSYISNVAIAVTVAEPDHTPPSVSTLALHSPPAGGSGLPATASSWSSAQLPGFPASAALDGSLETAWSTAASADGDEQSLIADLGSAQTVESVELWPLSSNISLFPRGFEVLLSPDGLEWVPVAAQSGYTATAGVPWSTTFPSVAVRYIEIVITDLARAGNGLAYAVVAELEAVSAAAPPGTVIATWTAPGDDGAEGRASEYWLGISACPFDEGSAVRVDTSAPRPAGASESARIEGLPSGTYCAALRASDEAGNASALSIPVEVIVP